jgi:glycosyltransferase involved in cell wall biosynthesis
MPRVARVITRMNVGGPTRHACLLTDGLTSRGYDCQLLYGSETAREGLLLPETGGRTHVPHLARRLNPLSDLRAHNTLVRLLHERKPHIVHTHMAKAGALGRTAARRAGVPIVVHTFHGHVLSGYFNDLFNRALVMTERKLADTSDALTAVSPSIRDELLKLGIGTPSKWHVIPEGLDLTPLVDSFVTLQAAREQLGLPTHGPLIGIVGRLVRIKDHDTFLHAAAQVSEAWPTANFVVAGDGELRSELESRARTILGRHVFFTGWVLDLATLYRALDIVVLSSRNEGTPITLLEAGAAGLPVVATRVGGVPDIVQDGETGLLAPTGRPSEIASLIIRLLKHPQLRQSMGQDARKLVTSRFSADRLVNDVNQLYHELLHTKNMAQAGRLTPQL